MFFFGEQEQGVCTLRNMYTDDSDDDAPQLVRVAPGATNEERTRPTLPATNEAASPTSAPTTATAATTTGKRPPVPVLLLSGFLGAGKSTLIQYILQAKHGYRIAVVMNEIGDTADIEKAAMIAEPEAMEAQPISDWVELENGCICCSSKDDLVLSLERLLQQRDRFDYIVIEGTGLMDAGAVATALWTDDEVQADSICLDAIVVVVDAKNIIRHLDDTRERINPAQRQIAYADVVLLNKTDLVDAETREEVRRRVREISDAAIIDCERCVVDLGSVLGTGLYRGGSAAGQRDDRDDRDDLAHEHNHHHQSSVGTETFLFAERLDIERLKNVMDELLWERPGGNDMEILRVKGLVCDADGGRVVLQAVWETYEVRPVGGDWEPGQPGKVVFIGSGLDRELLGSKLASCAVI